MFLPTLASVSPPIRHLVPLGAENRWSDLIATMIETDPSPVAGLFGLGDSPCQVAVQREAPAGGHGRIDLVFIVGTEKRCVAEAKVLSGLGLTQLRRYREAHPDASHHVVISLERLPVHVPASSGWHSVYWEDLLRAMIGSGNPWVAETASEWLSYVDRVVPPLSADTRWNDLRPGEDFVLAMRARMAWVYNELRPPLAVEHDLVGSTAGQSWVARLRTRANGPGYWVYAEAEERLGVRNYPKFAGDPNWGRVIGPSVKVCLLQTDVDTSTAFDWTYLRSLWPAMHAARRDWVTASARPKASHDRTAWKRMVAAGAPPYLGVGFGDSQAKKRGECMFGARFQLPADVTLAAVAAELSATAKLILELAALPHRGHAASAAASEPRGQE
jgi:hypothetical protein